jgi:hypothetical protein
LVGLHATTLTKTFQQKSENEWKRETWSPIRHGCLYAV